LEDECHCLDLELAKRNITHPDDTTTFATYASSLHQRASLQEEKDRLSNLIATINQVITYLALNLPNPQQNPGLQAACQQKINTEKRINDLVSIKTKATSKHSDDNISICTHRGRSLHILKKSARRNL